MRTCDHRRQCGTSGRDMEIELPSPGRLSHPDDEPATSQCHVIQIRVVYSFSSKITVVMTMSPVERV